MDKARAKQLLDKTFNRKFDIGQFSKFINELFNEFCIDQNEIGIWNEYREYIEFAKSLGVYTDSSKKVIEVFTVKLKKTSSRDRARTMQRNFIAKYLANRDKDAALVAFYGDDPTDWRFSFVKLEYDLVKDESGRVKTSKELTPVKRCSFLVGVNEPNHTCRKQFLELIIKEDSNPTIAEIEKAFSIDNVTKEFFEKYKNLYLKLKDSLEQVIEKDNHIKKHFDDKNILTVDFSKKLMGQIVFIYFLQKKGWLGVGKDTEGRFKEWGAGPKDFLRKLFKKKIVNYDNFFNDILEPLFYEALATKRDNNYYSRFECKIPFLNGGLFEPINDYDWSGTEILIDNSIFEEIFKTFDQFNFTVKEDEPLEKEVAVDPEMLGKVFENLLDVKDRKSRGAFYTPREIVHYMCQQSLINYLETNTDIPREDIEVFIGMGGFASAEDERNLEKIKKLNDEIASGMGRSFEIIETELMETVNKLTLSNSIFKQKEKIDNLLKEIKIVDPAVGSGAFLVGMMNEIVKAQSILTIFFDDTKQKERTEYNLKRGVIENCLYGVDIDSSAVDIAKLRFWLSLIVDEEDIKQIKPLPNLDHKIMCGNSLLEEFEGVKLFDEKLLEKPKETSFELNQIKNEENKLNQELYDIHTGKKQDNGRSKEISRKLKQLKKKKHELKSGHKEEIPQATLDEALQERRRKSQVKLSKLKKLQKLLFNEQNRNKKKEYTEKIDCIEWELIEETLKEQGNEEAMEKLEQYKKNKSKPFFLWKLYFSEVFQRENPGFDVVIGNPPYVRQELIKELKPLFEKIYPAVYAGTADLSVYFVKKSLELTNIGGCHSFIITNKWLRAKYGEKLRNYLAEEIEINEIIDFNGVKVFGATVDALVYVFRRAKPEGNILMYCDYNGSLQNIKNYVDKNGFKIEQDTLKEGWHFYPKNILNIKKKIEEVGTPLKDWDVKIKFGIKTGYNKAFIIDEKTREELIKKDAKSAEIIKPILRGRDINRYGYDWKGLYLIVTKNGINVPEKYPAIYNHLLNYEEQLKKRWDKGDYWYNLRHCAYYRDFEKPKIVWQEIVREPQFYYDTNFYQEATAFLMTGKNLKYLLVLLNSKPTAFFFKAFYAGGGLGESGYRYKKAFLEKLPIPKIPEPQQKPFIELADKMLSLNTRLREVEDDLEEKVKIEKEIKDTDEEIDKLVYELYELTPGEIEIVENFNREKK